MRLSVVFLSYNTRDLTEQALRTVLDAAEHRNAAVTSDIAAKRFNAYPAMDDPRKLIAAVGRA